MIRLLLSFLSITAIARADFDPERWQFRRRITIAMPAPLVSVAIDGLVYKGSRGQLADIRVVRDQIETPYIIRRQDRDEFSVSPMIANESNARTTLLTADVGFEGLPHDRVQLLVDPGQFYRNVEVESSSDSKKWKIVGHGFIFRTEDLGAYTVSFPEQWNRYVRVRIFNRDDAPLSVRQLVLSADRRLVDFPAEGAGQYWLYYGSTGARQPSYDFARIRPPNVAPEIASLGAEEKNPAYRQAEKPWSERQPGILYGVLAAAILIMGFIAVRFLLKTQS